MSLQLRLPRPTAVAELYSLLSQRLSHNSPLAMQANDAVAAAVSNHPDRFLGFATPAACCRDVDSGFPAAIWLAALGWTQ